jgi:hypothetical protein
MFLLRQIDPEVPLSDIVTSDPEFDPDCPTARLLLTTRCTNDSVIKLFFFFFVTDAARSELYSEILDKPE